MRAIVKAAVQRELGIALIPVDEKLAFHMTGRVMVSTLPKEFKDAPEGILPAVEHEIANDPRLQGFFTHERVDACGGVNAIEARATQFTKCQYSKHDLPETILDTERVGNSAVRICPGATKSRVCRRSWKNRCSQHGALGGGNSKTPSEVRRAADNP